MFQIGRSKHKLEYLIAEEFRINNWLGVWFCHVLSICILMNLGEISDRTPERFPIDSVDGRCTVPNLNAATPPEN